MRRALIAVALVLLAAPVAAQQAADTTNVQSTRQLRQRSSFNLARLENAIEELQAAYAHELVLYNMLHAIIVRDSLRAAAGPIGEPTPPDTTPSEPEPPAPPVEEPPVEEPPPPPAEEPLPDDNVAPLIEERFAYSSRSQLMSSPLYVSFEDQGTGQIALDTSVGYAGSCCSMRYTHTNGQTISRSLDLSGWNFGADEDVWIEIVVRFSPGWDVGFSYKLLHLIVNPATGRRFGIDFQEPRIFAEAPAQNWDAAMMWGWEQGRLFDGQWHTIRYHTQIIGGGSQVMHEWWIDGEYIGKKGPVPGNGSLSHVFAVLGANMNESNGQTQHLWWGRVRVWTQNPGW